MAVPRYLLTYINPNQPPSTESCFPAQVLSKRTLVFQPSWYQKYSWLHYSPSSETKGVLCFLCAKAASLNMLGVVNLPHLIILFTFCCYTLMYFGVIFKFKSIYHQRVTQPILCWRKCSKTYIPQGALNKIFSGNTLDPHCRRGDPLRTTPARLLYNRTDRRSSVRPVSPHRSTPLYASNIWKAM